MKIRPVILCGGAGTRLWPKQKNHQAKQFINFGNWTLLGKTLERVKASIFDAPIISTNAKYLRQVKQHLKKHKIRKFKIVLEPAKRRKKWKPKKINFGNGTLWKYAQTVGPAYLGAPTHPGGKNEVKTYADI